MCLKSEPDCSALLVPMGKRKDGQRFSCVVHQKVGPGNPLMIPSGKQAILLFDCEFLSVNVRVWSQPLVLLRFRSVSAHIGVSFP